MYKNLVLGSDIGGSLNELLVSELESEGHVISLLLQGVDINELSEAKIIDPLKTYTPIHQKSNKRGKFKRKGY